MALISGRPISFRMDLYQPLYVPRPVVEPELFASLRPPTYNGALEGKRDEFRALMPSGRPTEQDKAGGAKRRQLSEEYLYERETIKKAKDDAGAWARQNLDLQKGVSQAATATNLGDYFQYAIDHPISLARQKSAMLPIVQKE